MILMGEARNMMPLLNYWSAMGDSRKYWRVRSVSQILGPFFLVTAENNRVVVSDLPAMVLVTQMLPVTQNYWFGYFYWPKRIGGRRIVLD
jgi:hypothetical protein